MKVGDIRQELKQYVRRAILGEIPSLLGKLVYFSGLRDSITGIYEHAGVGILVDSEKRPVRQVNRSLAELHLDVFQAWLITSLSERADDLVGYLADLDNEPGVVIDLWLESKHYHSFVASMAMPVQRDHFLVDFEAVLVLTRKQYRKRRGHLRVTGAC